MTLIQTDKVGKWKYWTRLFTYFAQHFPLPRVLETLHAPAQPEHELTPHAA